MQACNKAAKELDIYMYIFLHTGFKKSQTSNKKRFHKSQTYRDISGKQSPQTSKDFITALVLLPSHITIYPYI